MNQALQSRLLQALKCENAYPLLREIAIDLWDQGHKKDTIERIFTEFLKFVMVHGTEKEEDLIRDVLDYITGWCPKGSQLFQD
jgi:hypothetical protein